MKVDKNQTIAGLPIKQVRDILRANGKRYQWHWLEERGEGLADALVREGLIEEDALGWYEPTEAGLRLCNANFLKRITHERAEQYVSALFDRIAAINADPDLVYRVHEVWGFGSYIKGDAADLGDIDLVVRLEFRDEKGCIVAANMARAKASGKQLDYNQCLHYGHEEVMLRLKNRCAYLSFHRYHTVDELDTEFLLLWEESNDQA